MAEWLPFIVLGLIVWGFIARRAERKRSHERRELARREQFMREVRGMVRAATRDRPRRNRGPKPPRAARS